jgi:HK97 family phage prohead protease
MSNEIRSLATTGLEIRKSNNKSTLVGLAVPYGKLSVDLGNFREKFMPGAFTASLRSNPDVRLNADHSMDVAKVLARTSANTLRISESNEGLMVEADLPNTTFCADLCQSIERGDVSGLSISFSVDYQGDDWQDTSDGVVRSVSKASLGSHISVVSSPAYPQTSVSLRSAPDAIKSLLAPVEDTSALLAFLSAKRRSF